MTLERMRIAKFSNHAILFICVSIIVASVNSCSSRNHRSIESSEFAARADTRRQAPLAKGILFALGCRDDSHYETSPDGRRLVRARAFELRSDAPPTRVQTLAMRFLPGAIHKPPRVTP